jgi:uncharacterized membrane protein YecN with MAPEG domain
MKILPVYAAILGLFFIFLSFRIIRLRRTLKVAVGDAGHPELIRAIRAHANFAEYVPLCLFLIFLAEQQNSHLLVIHGLCLTLLTARLTHAYGVSHQKEDFRFRVTGMMMTFAAIAISSLLIIINWLLS